MRKQLRHSGHRPAHRLPVVGVLDGVGRRPGGDCARVGATSLLAEGFGFPERVRAGAHHDCASVRQPHDRRRRTRRCWSSSIASAIDVRKLRAGQPYAIDRLLDGRVRRFEYEIDGDKRLTVDARVARMARRDSSPPSSASRSRPTVVTVEGDINRETNSLSAAIDKAGERIELALGMADVFSGEIDFNSDLQPGDKFRVLVERHTREGKLSGYGADPRRRVRERRPPAARRFGSRRKAARRRITTRTADR